MIDQKLSQFEITAKLGEGGMGAVYRARDSKLGEGGRGAVYRARDGQRLHLVFNFFDELERIAPTGQR